MQTIQTILTIGIQIYENFFNCRRYCQARKRLHYVRNPLGEERNISERAQGRQIISHSPFRLSQVARIHQNKNKSEVVNEPISERPFERTNARKALI